MKTKVDPRHIKRREALKALFAASYNPNQSLGSLGSLVWEAKDKLDPIIQKTAPEWPLDKLNRTDLAILRLALYELLIGKKEPVKVVIDEAIELAKEYGSESSPAFVNGVLGTVAQEHGLVSKEEAEELTQTTEEKEES